MEDKVVLVTGSSAGIGAATVCEFAKLGCLLVVHGTDETRVNEVAKKCQELSPKRYKPIKVVGNVKDGETLAELIGATIRSYGHLDILVNNAGSFKATTIDNVDAYKVYSDLIKINLDSVVLLTSLAVPHLKKTKGCVINVSSNLQSKCLYGAFAYSTAKAGLSMFTRSIAVDLAPDVRVNSVSPGPVATLMSSRNGMDVEAYKKAVASDCLVQRVGEPEEVARAIVFLASPESAFMTGTDILIDGGSSIKPGGKLVGQN